MVLPVTAEEFEAVAQQIKEMKRPYMIKTTSSSKLIKNDWRGYVTSAQPLGKAILGHLMSCKTEIQKRAKDIDLTVPANVQWCSVSNYFESELTVRSMFVNEFDLSHAYWKAALLLGFISEKTYHKFLKFKTKKFRLIALGMLAKKELRCEFDGDGVELSRKVIVDENGKRIFKRIAFEVASEMKRIAQNNLQDFRWYWFDNCIMSAQTVKVESVYEYKVTKRLMQFSIHKHKYCFSFDDKRKFVLPSSAVMSERIEVPF
jgi:hypothetical protein